MSNSQGTTARVGKVGQRCLSEREPELGLGVVASVDPSARRISIEFPAANEKRLYGLGTPVIKRVQFRVGDAVTTRNGVHLTVEAVEDREGLLTYLGGGQRVCEDEISDATSVSQPPERLMAGQVDPGAVFDLRYLALQAQTRFRQSDVRGFLGGRLQLLPHQFYILHEVAARSIPRVLLADEVGLGKTIEACLILQRLLAVGHVKRALILVPESLIHQWFVELLRRFNLWFGIFDAARCAALEESDPGQNPFLSSQLVLCHVGFLAGDATRREQAVAAGWDLAIVDEAHHLEWSPTAVSPEYQLVEELGRLSPGLLLLTATPTQLGLAGHFARLRLLDPSRYDDFERFVSEEQEFGAVAGIADKIVGGKKLTPKDHAALREIFTRDPKGLTAHLDALAQRKPGSSDALLRTLLDQHGTGRVVFRNTRASMSGFPARKYCPVPLAAGHNLALLARIARELRAEETGGAEALRYSFRDDPRIEWLVDFLKRHRTAKILLICKSLRKAVAIDVALQEKMAVKSGLFHEGLGLVQRDRNAAWFAESDGAQLLVCSEIGSEGRNFQFAHHLVLFDLPLNPGLLEQRIGRLDRIGQTQMIRIHFPFISGSSDQAVAEWYHRGLDAFESALPGGNEYQDAFKARLLDLATAFAESGEAPPIWEAFIAETIAFRQKLAAALEKGRDRLLELNSFDRAVAGRVIARIEAVDADPFLRNFLLGLLDHFGVRIKEHEEGDVFLDPSHAFIEGFPSIPAEGMLATFNRRRAIAREDIRFVSPDHALVQDAIDLLIESQTGTTAFGILQSDTPNLLLEAVFVLETVAESRWHVDRFLAATPVRTLVDVRGDDQSEGYPAKMLSAEIEEADIHRFLERPGFGVGVLNSMIENATREAGRQARQIAQEAQKRCSESLSADIQRLRSLSRLNPNVRPEEIALAEEQLRRTTDAIGQARLRLDALRLVMAGPLGRR